MGTPSGYNPFTGTLEEESIFLSYYKGLDNVKGSRDFGSSSSRDSRDGRFRNEGLIPFKTFRILKKKTSVKAGWYIEQIQSQLESMKKQMEIYEFQAESEIESVEKLIVNRENDVSSKEKELEKHLSRLENIQKEMIREYEKKIEDIEKRVSCTLEKSEVIKLNVGGLIFTTTLETITKENSFFTGYFSDQFRPKKSELVDGAYFIDRPGDYFGLILKFLRGIDIESELDELCDLEIRFFIEEVDFYQITSIFQFIPERMIYILEELSINPINPVKFDGMYCSPCISFLGQQARKNILLTPNRTKQQTNTYDCILGTSSSVFKVKLLKGCRNFMVGFAPKSINLTSHNECGYFLHVGDGKLYSPNETEKPFLEYSNVFHPLIRNGSIIRCKYFGGKISFMADGVNCGVAFPNVSPTEELFPAFEVFDNDSLFELV